MSERFLRVTPQQLLTNPTPYLVDIRPLEERHSALGFVPGSRAIPTETITQDLAAFSAAFEPNATVILVCGTGRRSAVLAEQLAGKISQTVGTLEGGTLGWGAEGLPLCGVHTPTPEQVPKLTTLEKFPRLVLSCFAAETVENMLDGRLHGELNPQQVIENAFTNECRNNPTRECLEAALERVAEVARRSGYKLSRIQENIDSFRASLSSYAGAA